MERHYQSKVSKVHGRRYFSLLSLETLSHWGKQQHNHNCKVKHVKLKMVMVTSIGIRIGEHGCSKHQQPNRYLISPTDNRHSLECAANAEVNGCACWYVHIPDGVMHSSLKYLPCGRYLLYLVFRIWITTRLMRYFHTFRIGSRFGLDVLAKSTEDLRVSR